MNHDHAKAPAFPSYAYDAWKHGDALPWPSTNEPVTPSLPFKPQSEHDREHREFMASMQKLKEKVESDRAVEDFGKVLRAQRGLR